MNGRTANGRTTTRRDFLRESATYMGLAIAGSSLVGALAACSNDVAEPGDRITIDLSNEKGAVNFVYALLQLEADMYYRADNNQYTGITSAEESVLQGGWISVRYSSGIPDFKTIQPAGRISDVLLFNFDNVNFWDRTSVLTTCQTVQEATANAYAGIGGLLSTPATASKISDIAAAAASRATAIRSALGLGAFTVTPLAPAAAMAIVKPYYRTNITLLNAGAIG